MILCGEAVYGYVIRLVFREEKREKRRERGRRKDGEAVVERVRAT